MYDSVLQLPYGILKRLNFPAQSLQQASRKFVGVMSHTRFTFWNKSFSKDILFLVEKIEPALSSTSFEIPALFSC